ncbi:MAG: DUF6473 family protein [Pseudomonadota bacterium]
MDHSVAEHLSGYQRRDRRVVDYQMYQEPASGLWFRGPPPTREPGRYITYLGAAQTFGCFCKTPFCNIIEEATGVEAVNLGYGGAGPLFYLRHPELIDIANRGRFAVIQVMSARSEDNSLYESGGLEFLVDRATGKRLSADVAYSRLLSAHPVPGLPAKLARAVRVFQAPAAIKSVIAETRANWVANYLKLFDQITVPIVVLWFSKRTPGLHSNKGLRWWWQRYDNVHAMFGKFPQLVNSAMIAELRRTPVGYVESVSERGSPQPLFDFETGEPVTVSTVDDRPDFQDVWTHNAYYPSPEMHEDAAADLLPVCEELLCL